MAKAKTDNLPDTRIFLVRHGRPEQHVGKIFLGQLDVPLSDLGRKEATAAGDRLRAHGAKPKRIYSSDLARAKETADIIAERLGGLPVIPDKLFREMAMGAWDGELIEDIKAKFPEEYARRGDDLRNYRVAGGENFYDLRGRVLREFHRIFREDFKDAEGAEGATGAVGATGAEGATGAVGATGATGAIGAKDSSAGDAGEDPGDLVIVAHLGVITVISEELDYESPGYGFGDGFPTGSVTAVNAPDWLWAEKGTL